MQGPLDAASLRSALDRIVARHEALRTRFVSIDGHPSQLVDGADRGLPLVEDEVGDATTAKRAFELSSRRRPRTTSIWSAGR